MSLTRLLHYLGRVFMIMIAQLHLARDINNVIRAQHIKTPDDVQPQVCSLEHLDTAPCSSEVWGVVVLPYQMFLQQQQHYL